MKSVLTVVMCVFYAAVLSACNANAPKEDKKLRALIIDGQNNHWNWPKSTIMMKQGLEETGMFTVDIERTQFTWTGEKNLVLYPLPSGKKTQSLKGAKPDPDFIIDFSAYDVVISNFGWQAATLPLSTQSSLEKFIANGGGLIVVHAADNSWPEWDEFNKMIGIGGWGNRSEKSGPWVYYDTSGKLVRDTSPGSGGAHGPQREFQVQHRVMNHPITKGLPEVWMHAQDELYERLRGPAENMTVLATSFSNPDPDGEGRHEPMLMTLDYGKGRVFHVTLGHGDPAHECVGMITMMQRGAEWVATGKVTQAVPDDFPSADKVSRRAFVYRP